jgi:type VI secretion system Hcp family effector
MAGESIDAFVWFGKGRAGRNQRGAAPQIKGETTDTAYRDSGAIQIRNYTFDFTMQTEGSEEKEGNKGTEELPDPTFAPVKITKTVDTASPLLFEALCIGAKYEKVDIAQRKAGGHGAHSGAEFWHVELRDVTIDNVNWSATETGELTESFSLRYEYIKITYQPQSHKGGIDKPSAVIREHRLKGAEGLKDKDKKKSDGMTDAQASGVVDKVIAELNRRGLIGHGSSTGGGSRHGR